MINQKRARATSVPIEPFFEQQLQDPEFRRAYEELEPEFKIVRQLIDLRLKRGWTQAQLAEKVGTRQPNIARLEGRGYSQNLSFLERVANALGAKVEVQIVPRETSARGRRTARKMKAN